MASRAVRVVADRTDPQARLGIITVSRVDIRAAIRVDIKADTADMAICTPPDMTVRGVNAS